MEGKNMAANGDTAVIPAQPVTTPGGDRIFQALAEKKRNPEDYGLVKAVLVYVDRGVPRVMSQLITPATLDKITNILEDELVG
jgi:hypothetical protein